METRERERFAIPTNVVSRLELFPGIGVRELARIVIVLVICIIVYLISGTVTEQVPETTMMPIATATPGYTESGEDIDIEYNLAIYNTPTQYEEVQIMVDRPKMSKTGRMLIIIIPTGIMILLSMPLYMRMNIFDYILFMNRYLRNQKRYLYKVRNS